MRLVYHDRVSVSLVPFKIVLRREAMAVLLGYLGRAARAQSKLAGLIGNAEAVAVVVDVPARRAIAIHGNNMAGGYAAPPGSTIKPFVLAALLRVGKLTPDESVPCPGILRIRGRSFNCSHPRVTQPMSARTALAYSCNFFVAHVAQRFAPGELATSLERAGLASVTGWAGDGEARGRISAAVTREATQLQALGEEPLTLTAAELVLGYRSLALNAEAESMRAIIEGMEDAVEYGTAQRAAVPGLRVAGKTGSVATGAGARLAWFAGFAPSRKPKVALVVLLQGRSGGSDAAPIAGRILKAWNDGW